MTTLIEKSILNERLEKSRSGTYADTSENRRKHRVGQKYGSEKKEEEKPEKTSSNEKDPAKELEAVDKVIAAINEGKLKLPQEEIMVLIEKKNNLELAKRQAEKIHSGVKANEEKRNAAEAKETSKKINEAQKEEEKKRGYRLDDSAIIKDSNKTKAEKISEIKDKYAKLMKKHADELNRMGIPSGHQLALLQRTRDEKIKEIEAQEEPKKEESRGEKKTDKAEDKLYDQRQKEETSEEVKESYTRVKFEDVPNSGKVNLKKYLSEKVRQGVDEKWSNIKNIPTDNLKKMEKGLVNDLNKNFEAIKKSQRAELLYSIMKVKGELEKRGKESQKKE